MNISTLLCTFKDIIYPVFGAIIAIFLVTCIPGVAENESIYDDEN